MSKKLNESRTGGQKPWPPEKPKSRLKRSLSLSLLALALAATLAGGANAASISFLDSVKEFFGISVSAATVAQARSHSPADPGELVSDDVLKAAAAVEHPDAPLACGSGPTINVSPGAGTPLQDAINAAVGGETLNIAAGTYPEQITINKCLTLQGAGSGATIIQAPPTMVSTTIGATPVNTIVLIRDTVQVAMTGLSVQGPNSNIDYGIFVIENAVLNMSNASVDHIRHNPLDGVQQGRAIRAGKIDLAQSGTLSLNNVSVTDYQKNGIVVENSGSNAIIQNSTITGAGAQNNIAQNGIVVIYGATATITGSTISGNVCNAPGCSLTDTNAFAVLGYQSGSMTVSSNTLDNNDGAVNAWSPTVTTTIASNNITNTRHFGIYLDQGNHPVSDNRITGTAVGPNYGVFAGSFVGSTGNTTANLQKNVISGVAGPSPHIGIHEEVDGGSAFTTALTANFNYIVGNGVGLDNTSPTSASVENNFWGCSTTPTSGPCDTVSGPADANPWLKLSQTVAGSPTINVGGTSSLSTSLRFNSDNVDPSAGGTINANLLPNGIPVAFNVMTALGGSFSPASVSLSAGLASSTFTANGTYGANSNPISVTPAVGSATDPVTITVNKLAQTITFNPPTLPDRTFGDPTFTVTATASSGLTVTFSSTGNCSVAGNTVTLGNAGPCTITADQAGNNTYATAPSVSRPFTINPANSTISVVPAGPFTYNGTPQGPGSSTVTGSTGPVTYSYSGVSLVYGPSTTKPTNAGSYTVTASVAADANYNGASSTPFAFTIGKATPTGMTYAITNTPIAADGNLHSPNVVVTGSTPSGGTATVTSPAAQSAAGTYAVTVTYVPADTANYLSVPNQSAGNFVIVAATVVIERHSNGDWKNWRDTNDTLASVQDDYVLSPTPQSLTNKASARLLATADPDVDSKPALISNLYKGTKLADITSLSYDTYVSSGSVPYLQFDVDFDLSTGDPNDWQGRAYFLPTLGVSSGSWQHWDALSAQGVWKFSGSGSTPFPAAAECTYKPPTYTSTGCTLARVLELFPKLGLRNSTTDPNDGLLFRTDASSLVYVDNLVVGVSSASLTPFASTVTQYDFERATSSLALPFACHNGTPFTYTGAPIVPSPCSINYTTHPDNVSGPATITFDDNIHVGPVTATATYAGDDNTEGSSATDTFVIQRALPIVTFGMAPNPTYLGGNFTVSASTTNTDSSALTYSVVSGPCALVSGSTFSSGGAGTCVVKASGIQTANFFAASANQSVTIAMASQTITFTNPGPKTYGDPDFNVSATAPGGTVTFSSDTPSVCTVTGTLVHIVAPGTCTIRAAQGGNANYLAAPDNPQSFAVNFCPTVSTSFPTAGFGQTVQIPVTTTDISPVDIYSAQFTFTYDSAVLTPVLDGFGKPTVAVGVVDPSAANPTTGNPVLVSGTTYKFIVSITSSVKFGDLATPDAGTIALISMKVVGAPTTTSPLTLSNFAYNNPVGPPTPICTTLSSGTLSVVLTNTTTAVTSSGSPSVYGSAVTFAAAVSSSPIPPPDTGAGATGTMVFKDGGVLGTIICSAAVTAGQATCTTSSLTVNGGGAHVISAEYSGDGNFNPSTGTLSGGQTVNRATLLVNANPGQTKVYGEPDPTPFGYNLTGFVLSETAPPVIIGGSPNCTRTGTENVGVAYVITCTAGSMSAANYQFATGSTATFSITARPATWTTNASGKVYGETDPSPVSTGSAVAPGVGTGFLVADGVTAVYSRASGENVGPYAITATLSASPGSLSNYTITNTGATFTITARPATWTTNASGKVYGEADPSPITTGGAVAPGVGTGFLVADGVTAVYSRAPGENVGPYAITAALSASPGSLSNYTITNTGATFTITARPATWTTNANGKVYGELDPSPITTGSAVAPGVGTGFLVADGVTAVYSRAPGENVGPYAITSTLSASPGSLGNYTITNTGATFTIGQRPATWTTNPNGKVYADTEPVPVTTGAANPVSGATGFLGADGVTATYARVAGEAPGTYQITATLSASPGNLANYLITNTGALFTITSGTINGNVKYAIPFENSATTVGIPNVTLSAPGTPSVTGSTGPSGPGVTGNYSLTLFGSGAYTVTPSKLAQDCTTDNGITSNDASLVSRWVVGLDTLTATQQAAATVSGTPSLSSFDAALIARKVVALCGPSNPTPTNLSGQWVFQPTHVDHGPGALGSATLTENYKAYMMGDVDGDWCNNPQPGDPLAIPPVPPTCGYPVAARPTIDSARAILPRVVSQTGSITTVPLRLENLNGAGINAYQFDIEFDPTVVEPADVAADIAGTLSQNLSVVFNAPIPGLLKVAVYGAVPATGEGDYLNLRFRTIGGQGASSPLTIKSFRFNDGRTAVATTDGQITVNSASSGLLRGKVMTPSGAGLRNAKVTLVDPSGANRVTTTSSFGFFQFDDLTVGQNYTLIVNSRSFRFGNKTVRLGDNVTDVELIGLE